MVAYEKMLKGWQMDSFEQAWNLVLSICKEKMTNIAFETWLMKIIPDELNLDEKWAKLKVPNDFYKNTIENCYKSTLKDAFQQVFGIDFEINIVCDQKKISKNNEETSDFSDAFSFDNFIVGPSNKFAHAAALAVASCPAENYNPLFIYGSSGLGKTHLLYAIRNYLAKKNPEVVSVYIKGDDFTNELIDSIRCGSTVDFHMKYRKSDLLLVDDIQFIAGKTSTQEEFFHTFNALYEGKKQIVLTSDKPPKEIQTLEDRLKTRFEWGLIADIQPPDFETRIAIIKQKAEELEVEISDEVCNMMANKLQSSIRQLEGAVRKIKARNMLSGDSVSNEIAEESVRDVLDESDSVHALVSKIIHEVAQEQGVLHSDIVSQKRSAKISNARKIAVKKVRNSTNLSLSEIGKIFGGRDHSTILHLLS